MAFTPFEKRRRLVARTALYTGLMIVGLLSTLFYRVAARPISVKGDIAWHSVDWESDPAVRLLQQYVRVPSDPLGDEYAAALWLSGPLQAAGIPTTVERVGPRQANLWATVGENDQAPLVLLNHLDVEPVSEDQQWDYPPFSGVLEPPLIHGRGTFDMKSYTIAQLLSVLDRAAAPDPTERPVRFIASAEEESGSELGLKWLLREHPDLLDTAWAVLTEGGLVEAREVGDVKYWAIEFSQRDELAWVACADTERRLIELRQDVIEYSLRQPRFEVTPTAEAFLRAYGPSRDREELQLDSESLRRVPIDPAFASSLPPALRSTLRSEPFVSKPRLTEIGWTSSVKLYLLPGVDVEAAREALLPDWLLVGITLQPQPAVLAAPSPSDHPVFEGINSVLAQRLPPRTFGPILLTTAKTDSRFLRQRGIPSYGWTPFDFQVAHTLRAGRPHEKSDLPGYTSGIELYREVVEYLATAHNRPR